MFRINRQRQAEEQASRAWDAIARGETPAASDFDATLVETIRQMQELGDQSHPDSTFADRLGDELMRAMETAALTSLPTSRALTTVPNGRHTRPSLPEAPRHLDWSRSRWALTQLATAALVILVLSSSFFALGSHRLRPEQEAPAVIPAVLGTTEASPIPAAITEDTILFRQRIDEIPPLAGWIGMERTILAPGATWALGRGENDGEGPWIYRVESGALTIIADDAISVTRTGQTQPVTIPAGTEVMLAAGDAGFTPSGVTSRWRNDEAVPVTVLDAGITTGGLGNLPSGVQHWGLIWDFWSSTVQGSPVTLSVQRTTVAPGAEVLLRDLPDVKMVYVEAGALDLVYDKADTPATPERVFTIHAGSGTASFGRTPERAVLANHSAEPLVLLTMTVVPANAAAATPQAP